MKIAKYLLLSLFLLFGCNEPEVNSPNFNIHISKESGGYLVMKGRWTLISDAPYERIPVVNSAHIECYKLERRCKEELAFLYTNADKSVRNKEVASNTLRPISFEYNITEWTDTHIKAKHAAPAADIELNINIASQYAERMFRETSARGIKNSNPIPILWQLK